MYWYKDEAGATIHPKNLFAVSWNSGYPPRDYMRAQKEEDSDDSDEERKYRKHHRHAMFDFDDY